MIYILSLNKNKYTYVPPKNLLRTKKVPSSCTKPKRKGTITPRCINVCGCSGRNGFSDLESKVGLNVIQT